MGWEANDVQLEANKKYGRQLKHKAGLQPPQGGIYFSTQEALQKNGADGRNIYMLLLIIGCYKLLIYILIFNCL